MKQPFLKTVPLKDIKPKEMIIHIRCNAEWKQKLKFLAEHDSIKKGRFISIGSVIRGAINKMFSDRQHTLYPNNK